MPKSESLSAEDADKVREALKAELAKHSRQEDLAKELGYSQQTISRLVKAGQPISLVFAIRFRTVTGVDPLKGTWAFGPGEIARVRDSSAMHYQADARYPNREEALALAFDVPTAALREYLQGARTLGSLKALQGLRVDMQTLPLPTGVAARRQTYSADPRYPARAIAIREVVALGEANAEEAEAAADAVGVALASDRDHLVTEWLHDIRAKLRALRRGALVGDVHVGTEEIDEVRDATAERFARAKKKR